MRWQNFPLDVLKEPTDNLKNFQFVKDSAYIKPRNLEKEEDDNQKWLGNRVDSEVEVPYL